MYKGFMTKRHTLRSVRDIALAFGSPETGKKKETAGKKRLAAFLRVSHQAACNWYTVGDIPNGYHYRLHLWAEHNGFELAPEAFGVSREGKSIEDKPRPKRVA